MKGIDLLSLIDEIEDISNISKQSMKRKLLLDVELFKFKKYLHQFEDNEIRNEQFKLHYKEFEEKCKKINEEYK